MDAKSIAHLISDRLEKALYKLILHTLCPYIDSSIKSAVGSVNQSGAAVKNRSNRTDIKRVLWAYRDMRIYLEDEELYLADFGIKPSKSKDIISWSTSSGVKQSATEIEQEYLESAKDNYERTVLRLRAVERALDRVADDDGYPVVECKYLANHRYTTQEICDELNISESTVRRAEARVLDRLKIGIPSLSDLDLGV